MADKEDSLGESSNTDADVLPGADVLWSRFTGAPIGVPYGLIWAREVQFVFPVSSSAALAHHATTYAECSMVRPRSKTAIRA